MSRHIMQPKRLTRRENKGKIYVKNIRKNQCRIQNRIRIRNQLKGGSGSEKTHSGSIPSFTLFHIAVFLILPINSVLSPIPSLSSALPFSASFLYKVFPGFI
jgi:hypothetical protein